MNTVSIRSRSAVTVLPGAMAKVLGRVSAASASGGERGAAEARRWRRGGQAGKYRIAHG